MKLDELLGGMDEAYSEGAERYATLKAEIEAKLTELESLRVTLNRIGQVIGKDAIPAWLQVPKTPVEKPKPPANPSMAPRPVPGRTPRRTAPPTVGKLRPAKDENDGFEPDEQ